MTTVGGHYFVSYSRVDADGFARELADRLRAGEPSYRLWMDRQEIAAGQDWDEEISEAIKTCVGVLFVLTPDSVGDASGCKNEWVWAVNGRIIWLTLIALFGATRGR